LRNLVNYFVQCRLPSLRRRSPQATGGQKHSPTSARRSAQNWRPSQSVSARNRKPEFRPSVETIITASPFADRPVWQAARDSIMLKVWRRARCASFTLGPPQSRRLPSLPEVPPMPLRGSLADLHCRGPGTVPEEYFQRIESLRHRRWNCAFRVSRNLTLTGFCCGVHTIFVRIWSTEEMNSASAANDPDTIPRRKVQCSPHFGFPSAQSSPGLICASGRA